MRKYTADNNRFIYNKIEDIISELVQGIGESAGLDNVSSLVLSGDCGKAEGLARLENGIPRIISTLKFYLFWEKNFHPSTSEQDGVNEFVAYLKERHGVNITIFLAPKNWLKHEQPSPEAHDVVCRSYAVYGKAPSARIFKLHTDPSLIKVSSGEDMMHDSLSGILFALETLNKGSIDSEQLGFISQKLNQLKMSLGDTCLTVFGNYSSGCQDRHQLLEQFFETWQIFEDGVQQRVLAYHDEAVAAHLNFNNLITADSASELKHQIDEVLKVARLVWHWAQQESLEQKQILARHCQEQTKSHTSLQDRFANIKVFGVSDSLNPFNKLSARERLQKCIWDLIITQVNDWEDFKCKRIEQLLNAVPEEGKNLCLISRYQMLWSRI